MRKILILISQIISSVIPMYRDTKTKKEAFIKLTNYFDGRTIKIKFPITNLSRDSNNGYTVNFRSPNIPGPVKYDSIGSISMNLTKEEALKVDKSTVLEISGRFQLQSDKIDNIFPITKTKTLKIIQWEKIDKWGNLDERLTLMVENPSFNIIQQNEKNDKEENTKKKTLEEEMVEDIAKFMSTNLGDTGIERSENQKKAFEQLSKKFNGRRIRLCFPIKDVNSSSNKNYYNVTINDIGILALKEATCEYAHTIPLKLSKEEALKIGNSSNLEISGNIRLENSGWFKSGARSSLCLVSWSSSWRNVALSIEKVTFKIMLKNDKGNLIIIKGELPPVN